MLPRLTLVTLLGCVSSLAAQNPDGPYWTEYPKPANTTSVRALGSLAIVETPSAVHLYSGLLRRWTVQPISANATVQATNRYCLIQDLPQVHAWSAATGTVETLTVSPSALVTIGSASSSWAAAVADGNTVHGFSGFKGQWVPQTITGQLQSLSLGSHSILAVDDTACYGFSAFFGTWVPTANRTGGTYSAFRSGAMVGLSGPDELKMFSSYQNTWDVAAFPNAVSGALNAQDGHAFVTHGNELALFSTMTGNIVRRSYSAPPTVYSGRNVAAVDAQGTLTGYAPGTDAMVPLPALGTGNILIPGGSLGSYAILDSGSSLLAFSGLTGTVSPGPSGAFNATLGDCAAYVSDGAGQALAYSALSGLWVPAPTGQQALQVDGTYESILVSTPTGYDAYSARTDQWASLTSSGSLVIQTSGALAAAVDANSVDVFDPGLGRWEHQATGPSPTWSVWRLTGIAHDGSTAYGYSLFHNTWESIALQGSVQSFRANSSIGYVETGSHVYVFTANGSLSNQSRFPEFSRFATRGGVLNHMQVGPAGAAVFGVFGTDPFELDLPPLGTLRVDPATYVSAVLGIIPSDGVLHTDLVIPNDLSLNGIVLRMQDLVVPVSGSPWITNSSEPYIW